MSAPTFELKTLTSTATEQDILPLFSLCEAVFGVDPEHPERNAKLPDWQTKLQKPNASFIYATQTQESTDPLGFFFSHPIVQPEIGHVTYHISIAAISPESRGLGIFPRLVEETTKRARDAGYEWLSVCTVPLRFTKMYRILQQHGWEHVAWRENGEKVLMKMKI